MPSPVFQQIPPRINGLPITISEAKLMSGIDASSGSLFSVSLTATRNVAKPLLPGDFQTLALRVTTNGFGITFDPAFNFGDAAPNPSTGIDTYEFRYNAATSKWDLKSMATGL